MHTYFQITLIEKPCRWLSFTDRSTYRELRNDDNYVGNRNMYAHLFDYEHLREMKLQLRLQGDGARLRLRL